MTELQKELYKVSQSTGKVQVWLAYADGAEVVTEYGEKGGKIQRKSFTAEAKNVGRSNETSPEEQAQKEVDALYVAQVKNKHYRESVAEAVTDAQACVVPMHLHNYKNHPNKIIFPCWGQRKMDGSRANLQQGIMYSKIGLVEELKIARIKEAVEVLSLTADCEAYIHGLGLQDIRSAWLKNNENSHRVKLTVFEIPVEDVSFEDRVVMMRSLEHRILDAYPEYVDLFEFEYPVWLSTKEEAEAFHDQAVLDGYEGVVYTNEGSIYEFGKKVYHKQKSKRRFDAEAFCYGIENCKNGDGKLLLRACDELNNVEFKAMMKVKRRDGKDYPRDYDSMKNECLGQWITFSYEDLSEVKEKKGKITGGKPTKPVAEQLRECDTSGTPTV